CLDVLRTRAGRREDPLDGRLPDPGVTEPSPEDDAVLADSVGLALLVVLDTLPPAERLALVLHDVVAVPVAQLGPIPSRPPAAGLLAAPGGRPAALLTATVVDGRISELDILADPARLARLIP